MMKAKSKLLLILFAILLVLGLSACGNEEEQQEQPTTSHSFYWNVDRVTYTETSDTGLSTREKADDGLYHIRLLNENGITEFTTADKQLVNLIDATPVFSVELDGNTILDIQAPGDLGYSVNRGVYVVKTGGDQIIGNSSLAMNGMKVYVTVGESTKILRACGSDNQLGKALTIADLMTMDGLYTISDSDGNCLYVYLMEREDASAVYWRAETMYSSTTKETTRVPDDNGVYTIDFLADGERVSVKCKDRDLVNTIDRTNRYIAHFALAIVPSS